MKCVKIKDGVVVNSAIWKSCPAGWVESDAGIGWLEGEDGVLYRPVITVTDDELAARNLAAAKTTRNAYVESDIEAHGVVWQVDVKKDEPRMRRAIDAANDVAWILSDNTVRETTADELREVVIAKAQREARVFAEYVAWRAGDTLTAFTVADVV